VLLFSIVNCPMILFTITRSVVTSSRKVWYPTSFMYATSPSIFFKFVTCFVVLFSVLIVVHGEFSGVLIMDDSKLETKDNHGEWAAIRCIFRVIYEKRE
jgi:hypothetical protein